MLVLIQNLTDQIVYLHHHIMNGNKMTNDDSSKFMKEKDKPTVINLPECVSFCVVA
jgi:hypothetical protein